MRGEAIFSRDKLIQSPIMVIPGHVEKRIYIFRCECTYMHLIIKEEIMNSEGT